MPEIIGNIRTRTELQSTATAQRRARIGQNNSPTAFEESKDGRYRVMERLNPKDVNVLSITGMAVNRARMPNSPLGRYRTSNTMPRRDVTTDVMDKRSE